MGLPKLLASLAVVVVALAWPALGAAAEFEAETYPVEVLGDEVGKHAIGVEDGLSLQCSNATFKGELDIWSSSEEVTPQYSECVAFGFTATVATNGCTYVLYAGEELAEPGDFEGTIDIKCPAGQKIAVVAATCEIQIGGQEKVGKVEYDNDTEASPDEITFSTALTGIKYTKTKDGFACPLTGLGEKADGTYSGVASMRGEDEAEQKGVAVAKPPNTKLCESEPNPKCAKFFPAGTKIEAKRLNPSPEIVFGLYELKNGPIKNSITCTESKFEAEMEAEAGIPLKGVTMTFSGVCKTFGGTACTVKMENPSTKGLLRWGSFFTFSGHITINTFDLLLECKGALKCEYVAAPLKMEFYGGAKAKLGVSDWLSFTPVVGEENCWQVAGIGGTYEVTKPAGAWVVK